MGPRKVERATIATGRAWSQGQRRISFAWGRTLVHSNPGRLKKQSLVLRGPGPSGLSNDGTTMSCYVRRPCRHSTDKVRDIGCGMAAESRYEMRLIFLVIRSAARLSQSTLSLVFGCPAGGRGAAASLGAVGSGQPRASQGHRAAKNAWVWPHFPPTPGVGCLIEHCSRRPTHLSHRAWGASTACQWAAGRTRLKATVGLDEPAGRKLPKKSAPLPSSGPHSKCPPKKTTARLL